ETIHPFLDGNGRLGRLLITLMLCSAGALRQPILYLSLYFKTRRTDYYRLLQEVRENGAWEEWMEFFLAGVRDTARQAVDTARSLTMLFERDRASIQTLKRSAASALRVHEFLQRRPVVTIQAASRELGLTFPVASKSIDHLATLGIVHETTGKRRNRAFAYRAYLDILDQGTEPL